MSRTRGPARRLLVALFPLAVALAAPVAARAGGPSPIVVEQPLPAAATSASFGGLVPFGPSRLLALAYTFALPARITLATSRRPTGSPSSPPRARS